MTSSECLTLGIPQISGFGLFGLPSAYNTEGQQACIPFEGLISLSNNRVRFRAIMTVQSPVCLWDIVKGFQLQVMVS